MKTPKEKHIHDLLDLPQKERIQLCKEIHSILTERVREEKGLQTPTVT